SAGDRENQVIRVGERNRHSPLQERVADDAAAEPRQDGEDSEPDQVEAGAAGGDSAEDGVSEHTREVDDADDVVQVFDGGLHPPIIAPSSLVSQTNLIG